jgi:antitoxin CptB
MRREHERIRWRCRRGLLELDLVLNGFLESRFEQLTSDQRGALTRLLDLPDNDLLDMIMGRAETSDPGCAEIVRFLR